MARKNHIDAIADDITEDIYTNNGLSDEEKPQVVSEDVDTTQIAKKMKRNIAIPDRKTSRFGPPYEPSHHEPRPHYEPQPQNDPSLHMFRDHRYPPPARVPMRMPVVLPTDGSIRIVRGDDGRPTLNRPIPVPAPVVEAIARPAGKLGKRKLDL